MEQQIILNANASLGQEVQPMDANHIHDHQVIEHAIDLAWVRFATPRALDVPEATQKTSRSPLRHTLESLVENLRRWRQRSVSRRQLLAMDDRMLNDIGLTRMDVHQESAKWFWAV